MRVPPLSTERPIFRRSQSRHKRRKRHGDFFCMPRPKDPRNRTSAQARARPRAETLSNKELFLRNLKYSTRRRLLRKAGVFRMKKPSSALFATWWKPLFSKPQPRQRRSRTSVKNFKLLWYDSDMMKKRQLLFTLPIFAITLIAVFTLFLAPEPTNAAFGPFNPLPPKIVPDCSITLRSADGQITGLDKICTFCDFLTLIQNILNYIWWVITPFVIVIALIWGGALMFISSTQGNVTQAQRGKKIIFNTLVGFVLVFGAWLIIDTVIKILGGKIGSNTATAPFGPWNKIECIAPVVSTTLPPPLPPPIPPEVITTTGSAAICSKIRTNSRISYGSEDCKELLSTERVGAKRTIDDCASSQPTIICEYGCNDKAVCKREPSVTINPKMLAALDI